MSALANPQTCKQFTVWLQVWIAPGLGIADDLLQQLQSLSSNSEVVMVSIFALFAVVHSGLAYLRPWGIPFSFYCFLRLD